MKAVAGVIIQFLLPECTDVLVCHQLGRYAEVLVVLVEWCVVQFLDGLLIKWVKASLMLRIRLNEHEIASQVSWDILATVDAVELLLFFVYVRLECYLAYSPEYLLPQAFVEMLLVLCLQVGQVLLLMRQEMLLLRLGSSARAIGSIHLLAFASVDGIIHPDLWVEFEAACSWAPLLSLRRLWILSLTLLEKGTALGLAQLRLTARLLYQGRLGLLKSLWLGRVLPSLTLVPLHVNVETSAELSVDNKLLLVAILGM